ncbi:DUF2318 domain-containing protein [Geothermobacter hydrogeniphilus]|uniref:Membrane iron-sulfur containing protein FtrD-like domain-containing protein n=1 Tax=Geothermobacter hydrogeniphilus TaxID=1969733 RepID=A0A1X0Y618_9BACT|nr:DUF2318 domain-containing protein [Geothermobacter hydrogeniphilus]ORJ60494.1 hypothetical protein B5V00_07990 [Geothermobacter hydrogeniphilus]
MSDRQTKRDQFKNEEKKSAGKLLLPGVLALLAIVTGAAWLLLGSGGTAGARTVTAAEDGVIRLAASDFDGGRAQFFRYESRRGPITFFVVRSQDGVIRAAFDACDVCYKEKKGYRQEGDAMICNNCGQSFPSNMVNIVKGGCNPSPLSRQLAGGQVLIQVAALEQGARYF